MLLKNGGARMRRHVHRDSSARGRDAYNTGGQSAEDCYTRFGGLTRGFVLESASL